MYKKHHHIHFVGIGGIGMSGIAEVLKNLGYRVSGSDIAASEITRRLEKMGCEISIGHRRSNLGDADVVVYSSAIRGKNPELSAARERSIPVIPRAEMLAELMRMKYGIAVAGAHGKTTTTSMIAAVLAHGQIDPTVVIGGRVDSLGGTAKLGQGEFLVAEADESDGSFIKLSPTIAVVTNIDREHLDHYSSIEEIEQIFLHYVNKVPFYGLSVLCLDDEHIPRLLPHVKTRYVTYGISAQADIHAVAVEFEGPKSSFGVVYKGEHLGRIILPMPGLHNIYNALAAAATAFELEIPFSTVKGALEAFTGVHRRFEILGEIDEIMVVDDYGHHPAEIRATLKAAKEGWNRRTVVIFQPHRYTRTKHLYEEFLTAFYEADLLFITDIYPAGEEKIEGVDSQKVVMGIRQRGHKDVHYVADKKELIERLRECLRPKDMVITLGAGDIWKIGERLIKALRQRRAGSNDGDI